MQEGSPPVDLLVVGGLTIDRFANGTTAAGGTVLHATLPAAGAGFAVAVLTVAGDEPEAVAALEQLRVLGPVERRAAGRTICFVHDESGPTRRLTLETPATPIRLDARTALPASPAGVLLAPVAGELDAAALAVRPRGAVRAAILQGWLRTLEPGRLVRPLGADTLSAELRGALGALDLLIASREDLIADGAQPAVQLAALRAVVGAAPIIVVTNAADGALLDDPRHGTVHVPAPYRVEGVPMVGAGDAYAAVMTGELASQRDARAAAHDAAAAVAGMLAARRS